MAKPIIKVEGLTKVFVSKERKKGQRKRKKEVTALKDIDLEVRDGEVFGLLGPNGAGKTTLIKILATLLLPTSGTAKVAGFDVSRDPFPIRTKINMVSGGETSGYGLLTTRENIWMFSQFYGVQGKVAKGRIDELLHTFGLWDKRDSKVRTLSSGQRQKMNMIRGFVTDPEILFLDEPTLGLDVNASRVIRDYVKDWVRKRTGKTVLLTTHYMMEADEMCDRIAIIDHGRIVGRGTHARHRQVEVGRRQDHRRVLGLEAGDAAQPVGARVLALEHVGDLAGADEGQAVDVAALHHRADHDPALALDDVDHAGREGAAHGLEDRQPEPLGNR